MEIFLNTSTLMNSLSINTDILETNDWCLDDTMYMMTCDPVLEEIKIE